MNQEKLAILANQEKEKPEFSSRLPGFYEVTSGERLNILEKNNQFNPRGSSSSGELWSGWL